MAFGISVSDFLAVGRLIYNITNALRDSRPEYQELVRELESLARALYHVDQLKAPPNQTLAVDHIKCAALMCRQPLEDFHRKIQKFEKNLDVGNSSGILKDAAKKAQWAFGLGKQAEVGKLRSYLNIHIGIINMQLIQHGFEKVDIVSEVRAADHQALMNSIDESMREVKDMRGDIQTQTLVVKESNSMIQTFFDMFGGDISAPLKALTRVVTKVCASTQQIYNIALEIRASTCGIDTRFTYFQSPVKVEDVLGRVFLFPAEFSIAALDAEIVDRFKVGPGKSQVAAGHYEIFNAKNTDEVVGITADSILRPGIPDCDTWFKNSGKKRKRGRDAPSLLDDPEHRKKLKSSTRLFQNHEAQSTDINVKDELDPESNSATSHVGAFKRISFFRGHQAPKYKKGFLYYDKAEFMKRLVFYVLSASPALNIAPSISPATASAP
ncbi:MAG: hypothetical protein Q9214_004987 [Letrouitia sp. 1 TL-2023]